MRGGVLRHGRRPRDDSILASTRWVSALIIPFLTAAFVILYIWPDRTDQLFAWTIRPRMTPLLMGAGYIAGAYFFVRVVTGRRWHHVTLGFPAVAAFATVEVLATILHWDRFNYDHISFWAWVLLYVTTPWIVLGLWLRNRRLDPGEAGGAGEMPPRLRRFMAAVGVVHIAVGVILFLAPDLMIGIWPWRLTALTARVLGGWFVLPGVFWLVIALDHRWSAARIPMQSQMLGLALILVGVARAWGDFDPARPTTWIFLAGMSLWFLVVAGIYVVLDRHLATAGAGARR